MEKDYSATAFFEFMDYLGAKGILKQNTAASRKAAGAKMLEILEEDEKQDLRKIDVNELHSRFANIAGMKYTQASLKVYKSRFKRARQDFIRFVDNPSGFKPSVSERETSSNNSGTKPKKKGKKTTGSAKVTTAPSPGFREPLVVPVPIRSDVTVEIHNLPDDLSEAEAARVAAIVQAFAKK